MNAREMSARAGIWFALGGAIVTLVGIGLFLRELPAGMWPSAEANLLEARLDSRRVRKGVTHFPVVRYSYTVGLTTYEGKKYALTQWSSRSKTVAEGTIERLRERQREEGHIVVHYDPENPAESVVENRPSFGSLLIAAIASVFLFVGLGKASVRARRRTVFFSLAIAGGAFIAMAAAYILCAASGLTVSPWLALAWPFTMLSAVVIAACRSAYACAHETEALSPAQPQRHVAD